MSDRGQVGAVPATSRDLAAGSPEDRAPTPTRAKDSAMGGPGRAPLLSSEEAVDLRTRWQAIQVAFVGNPRQAAQQADGLVAEVLQLLAQRFAQERTRLEQQWNQQESSSTEDLRLILRQYRTFFDALLQTPAGRPSPSGVNVPGATSDSDQATSPEGMSGGEEFIEIPVIEEQLVKQPVVKEVLRIRKQAVGESETVNTTLRREDVDVVREGDVEVHDQQEE